MKGLIIKDLYVCKNNIIVSILSYIIISAFCLLLQIEFITPFIIITLIGTTIAHSIINDKKSGWENIEKSMPVTKNEIIRSKYILYLIMITLSYMISMFLLKFGTNNDISEIFYILPISSGLILGSILIPCNYILGIDKSYLGMMVSILFTIFTLVTFSVLYLAENIYILFTPFFSITLFIISYIWLVQTKNKM